MNREPIFDDTELPGLYQSANLASINSQYKYFSGLSIYLGLLISASFVAYISDNTRYFAIGSAFLFLTTLSILIWLRVKRPDHYWYNGRAVAESVKTRSWRWMMRADPYVDCPNAEIASKSFISDLKEILTQNISLSLELPPNEYQKDPITPAMKSIRELPIAERLLVYKKYRIDNQASWYAQKALYNKKKSQHWFLVTVAVHVVAIAMLIFKVARPNLMFPVGVMSTSAGAIFTWLKARKHNELQSSYSLTVHEIYLIKGEAISITTEED